MTDYIDELPPPSEMLKNIDKTPLKPEEIEIAEEIQEAVPSTIPELPALKSDDLDNLKTLLDNIINDEDAVNKKIDYDYYKNNHDFFGNFMEFTLNYTPMDMDLKKYINSLTNFNYDPFEGIRPSLLFSMQDRLMYIHEMGKIFDEDFLGKVDIKFTLHDIDLKLSQFIGKHQCPFSNMEHNLINTMCGKLLLSIYSNIEHAFVQKTSCLTPDYVKIIQSMNKNMQSLCQSDKYIMRSWSLFISKLLDTKTMFTFKNYTDLSDKLKICYDNEFPIEILFADAIKSLIPSIGLNYINAIKNVYIIGRLWMIYLTEYMKSRVENIDDKYNKILTDLIIITRAVLVEYESDYFASAMIPRSMPKSEENVSEEFKLYYISHTLTGPQFYLLKQLEYTIPSVGIEIGMDLLKNIK